jgi:hypothetical protein
MMIPYRLIAYAVCAVAVIGGFKWLEHRAEQRGYDRAKTEQVARDLETLKATQAKERELLKAKQLAEVKYVETKQLAKRDAAAAGNELDRLRNELAKRNDSTAIAGTDGTTERELFGTCAGAITDMAREADEVTNKLTGLQGYVNAISR